MINRHRVLIIDDNRRVVDQLLERFTRDGYEAEIALSAPVGLSIVEARHMDVAVLNADLGHESDWQLVKRLKKSAPDLRVVLFNAEKLKGLSREARRAGVARFLSTPSDLDVVLAEVKKVMRN